LVIVVVVALLVGLFLRARTSRRLTIEQSVDRYRRTLSAVHDAAARSRPTAGAPGGPIVLAPSGKRPPRSRRSHRSRARWLAVGAMAVVTVATVAVVIAENRDPSPRRAAGTTTTRPPATQPTTTTRPAPTTTVALVTAGGTGTTFMIANPTYTLVVRTTTGACWIDARDAAGATLFSGTLSTGQSQSITARALSLQLGNPAAVTLRIDGKPVPFTLANGSPVTLHFQGTATS
jgi:hypothetical protein